MAKFELELPKDLIEKLEEAEIKTPELFEKMTRAGAEVVYKSMSRGVGRAFKSGHSELRSHLKITKPYRTAMNKSVGTKVAFYGYYRKNNKDYVNHRAARAGYEYGTGYKQKTRVMSSGIKEAYYIQEGVPVPLIVGAREFGTSRGEQKKPFVRRAFHQRKAIENAMKKVHDEFMKKYEE